MNITTIVSTEVILGELRKTIPRHFLCPIHFIKVQREEVHVTTSVFGLLVSACTVLDVSGSQKTPGSCPELTDAHTEALRLYKCPVALKDSPRHLA